jgi:hypothetical protein
MHNFSMFTSAGVILKGKEEANMTYSKPEVVKLGDAVRVIEQTGQKNLVSSDPNGSGTVINPAYDLDE